MTRQSVAIEHPFLADGGVTGELVRSIDWSRHPLGAISTWPESLKVTVATILHARHPMFLWWGPDLFQFYNDAYLPSFGVGRHPAAMGQRGRACWGEIWDIISPQIDDVMLRGQASWNEDALVPIIRNGKLEDVYWTYGYSPVFDADGVIRGTLVVCTETTAHVVAERALAASELRYRHLIEDLPEPVMVHIDGRIAYANAASAQGLGVASAEELVGHSIVEFASASTRTNIEARMRQAASAAQPLDVAEETFVRPRDGSEFHAEVRTVPVVYEGRPAMLSIARDLTARVEAARERDRLVVSLEFERRRLGMLLQHAPAFIAVLRGKDHVFELVNDAYEVLIGRSGVVGRPLLDVMPELRGQGILEMLDRVLTTGERVVVDGMAVTLVRRTGSAPEQRYLNFVYQPLVEADGTRSGVFALGVDVTDATRAQHRVRAQFHGVPMPTYIWQRVERDGRRELVLADFNEAAITASHGEVAKHLRESAASYFAHAPAVIEEIERCLDRGVTTQREMDQKEGATGETRRVFVTYAPAPPDLVIVCTEDVTDRVKLEQQLRQSQKMDAIGRLAGGVAHDFNNLLSVILGFTDLSMAHLKPPDPLLADLEQIKVAAQRATALTRQLLAFSRQQVLQPHVLDLSGIVMGMKSMLGRLLGEDVELVVTPSSGIGLVLADPGQIEQVVMNLAVNARDAMPEGGKLTIELENVVIDESPIGAGPVVPAGPYTMLAISDNGVGMDVATRARVFEPFFTTKEMGKGTGLGLATVFGIVQQSGGHVAVYSELGVGTTFKVYLPRTDRVAEAAPVARLPATLGGSETILLTEDEEQVRVVAGTILRRHGYHVLDASNGPDALVMAACHMGRIDLLLTDVVMPRMSGRRLAEQLVVQRPDIKVLFASGYTDDAIVRHGVLDGGTAFLQKPFTPQGLLRKVREVLDQPSVAAVRSTADV